MERQTSSPGKLILSGEHAVVRGCPAVAMAIDLEARVTARVRKDNILNISLPGRPTKSLPLADVLEHISLDRKAREKGSVFRTIALEPEELLARCAGLASPASGVELVFESTLPIGAGLGSSAAFILALLKNIRPELPDSDLEALAVEGEHYQHGKTSGLDVAVSLRGGLLHFQHGICTPVNLSKGLFPFRVYQSGKPESSTGECVAQSQHVFTMHPELEKEFAAVTEAILMALRNQNEGMWSKGLRENHRLLCRLGVVPEPIQNIISGLEASGLSAKVCGAGSVQGLSAGMVLVSGPGPHPVPATWQHINIYPASRGTRLL